MKKIVVIHGPNLSLLGLREPEIYGNMSLDKLNGEIETYAQSLGVEIEFHQFNTEGEIVQLIHECRGKSIGLIINPGGFSHTSVAILDALLATKVRAVEVHLTNVHQREEFRQTMVTARGAIGVITGFGLWSYLLAVHYFANSPE